MKLTKNQARGLCRDHWTIIARMMRENPYLGSEVKFDSLREMGYNPLRITAQCFCCAYDYDNPDHCGEDCIIPWQDGSCIGGEYHDYYYANTDDRWLIAEHIAVMADRAITKKTKYDRPRDSIFGLSIGDRVKVTLRPKLDIEKIP